jgi:hypothetical protein
MYGPFKWWTLVSSAFVALNGLPIIPWIFYMFYEDTLTYEFYYRIVGLSALGPIFLYWFAAYLIYNGYDGMNFIKDSDINYDSDFPLLLAAVGFDLVINSVTYYSIAKKFYIIEYISMGYCIYGTDVKFCPEKPMEDPTNTVSSVSSTDPLCRQGQLYDSKGNLCPSL